MATSDTPDDWGTHLRERAAALEGLADVLAAIEDAPGTVEGVSESQVGGEVRAEITVRCTPSVGGVSPGKGDVPDADDGADTEDGDRYWCGVCGFESETAGGVKKHHAGRGDHDGVAVVCEEEPHQCEDCGEVYKHDGDLASHRVREHIGGDGDGADGPSDDELRAAAREHDHAAAVSAQFDIGINRTKERLDDLDIGTVGDYGTDGGDEE
jgi:hypothetical protein